MFLYNIMTRLLYKKLIINYIYLIYKVNYL